MVEFRFDKVATLLNQGSVIGVFLEIFLNSWTSLDYLHTFDRQVLLYSLSEFASHRKNSRKVFAGKFLFSRGGRWKLHGHSLTLCFQPSAPSSNSCLCARQCDWIYILFHNWSLAERICIQYHYIILDWWKVVKTVPPEVGDTGGTGPLFNRRCHVSWSETCFFHGENAPNKSVK